MKHFEVHLAQPNALARKTPQQIQQGCNGEIIPHRQSDPNPRAGWVCSKCGMRIGLKESNPAVAQARSDWARARRG